MKLKGVAIAYFITFFVGRVIWEYETDIKYSDFDLKPSKQQSSDFYRM